MKNGLLIWNIVLTLVVGFLLFTHFGGKKNGGKTAAVSGKDTATSSGPFRIAYFEMDSVASNFELAKDLMAEKTKKEDDMAAEMDRMGKNLQQRYNFFQNKAQAGTLTQAESDAAGQEMKALDEQIKNRRQQLEQDYNDFLVRRQNDLKSKIKDFIKEYNKSKNYTYIVSDDPGLFYYQDTIYNITKEVVEGLNEMYKGKK
jgi:outer membrane protein